MSNTLFNSFTVIIDPFDEDVPRRNMMGLTPTRSLKVLDVEGSAVYFEGESGLEGRLGLAVEVDAELLEVG
jgi:hypothetical protein